jgi:hypothetical protein
MIEYPKEIENENQKAWYLRHFLGFTYKQIGKELNRSTSAVHKDFFPTQKKYQRQSPAVIYRKQMEFCREECQESIGDCRECNLYKFMVSKMLKKVVRA